MAQREPQDTARAEQEAHKIAKGVAFCLATVVGKYAAYPQVDETTFERVHQKITAGLIFHCGRSLGNFCQELRAVISCPVGELIRPENIVDANGNPKEFDETELRLIALSDVVRSGSRLSSSMFREMLTGVLSWDAPDRRVILNTLTNIVRGS